MEYKILHLSSERSWRGGEQQIAYLLEEQQKQGLKTHVAVKRGSSFENYCRAKGVLHTPLPFSNSLDLRTAFAIKRLCSTLQIDLVHIHSSKSHGIAILSAMIGNSTPLILSRRVDFVPKKSLFTQWKYNHSSIKKILCVSNAITKIMQQYVRDPKKCVTVHSGIDINKFKKKIQQNVLRSTFKVSNTRFLIGNTSALEAHKNYHTFIDTIEILVKKELSIHAFIIGKGSLENVLKEYCTSKGLENNITFTGFRDDLIEVIPELDAFLMTSDEEGLGTSVLDAFAAEVPVVATCAGGIPEMVEDEVTGFLAPIKNAKKLASAIEILYHNKSIGVKISEGAKEKLKHFSKENTAEKTLNAYREVLKLTSQ